MPKCFVCGKTVEKGVFKNGKSFCCAEHLKQFEDPTKPNKNNEVCEFC